MTAFHYGELEIQQRLGVQAAAARLSALIQPTVPAAAFDFIRQQTCIWLGMADGEDRPWAFPLLGLPGFIEPNDGDLLDIELGGRFFAPEPWLFCLQPDKALGCLLIDFASRRRLRVNGIVNAVDAGRLQLAVRQVYPNCQKYISKREMDVPADGGRWRMQAGGERLDEFLHDFIKQADTAFVASLGPDGADVSHRGGPAGFIACVTDSKLSVPDYQGNNLFNTLGNFRAHPVAGLTVVELGQGRILQLTGDVELIAGLGADRRWELTVKRWRLFLLEDNGMSALKL